MCIEEGQRRRQKRQRKEMEGSGAPRLVAYTMNCTNNDFDLAPTKHSPA